MPPRRGKVLIKHGNSILLASERHDEGAAAVCSGAASMTMIKSPSSRPHEEEDEAAGADEVAVAQFAVRKHCVIC